MRVLALDAATEACSVALLTEDGTFVRGSVEGRGHAEDMLEMVDAVLAEAGVALSGLDGIAASVGPGAFTGVRISVSMAQGLAFGAGLPVVGITTLEALALKGLERRARLPGGARRALACLDARMGEVYWGCFATDAQRGVIALDALRVSLPSEVRLSVPGALGVGRGFAVYAQLAALPGLELDPKDADALPEALQMARLGRLRLSAGEGLDPADLKPEYVRDKVAWTEAERALSRMRGAAPLDASDAPSGKTVRK